MDAGTRSDQPEEEFQQFLADNAKLFTEVKDLSFESADQEAQAAEPTREIPLQDEESPAMATAPFWSLTALSSSVAILGSLLRGSGGPSMLVRRISKAACAAPKKSTGSSRFSKSLSATIGTSVGPQVLHRSYSAVGKPRPDSVGVVAIDAYFPRTYVSQADLGMLQIYIHLYIWLCTEHKLPEAYDGVSAGKYQIGLGQTTMAFCNDREDIYSMSLTGMLKASCTLEPDVNFSCKTLA